MGDVTLKGAEIVCLKKLAERFEKGELLWRTPGKWELIGLDASNFVPVLTLLESIGVIEEFGKTNASPFRTFNIYAKAVQYARQLEEQESKSQERKDIVEIVKLTLRKHPLTAWSFLAFVAIGALLAFVNQVLTFLKNVHIID